MKPDKFNFHKKIEALKRAKVDLPNDLAQSGQVYFQRNFNKQQWDGKKWDNVQRRIPGTKAYKYAKPTSNRVKPIGVLSGKLKQAMQNTVREKTYKKIVWGVDLTYAKYFNFGTNKMASRKIMGGSKEMVSLMKRKINLSFNKVMFTK